MPTDPYAATEPGPPGREAPGAPEAPRVVTESPPILSDGGGVKVTDPRDLLLAYLDWYRETVLRKVTGLSDEQLRTPVPPLGWSPLGMIRHLGGVERRWLRWGFAAEDVQPYPTGDEFAIDAPTGDVLAEYREEIEHSRRITAAAGLADPSTVGGRFATPAEAPSLGRILFHLLQEYARHAGHLDVARELIDGVTGE